MSVTILDFVGDKSLENYVTVKINRESYFFHLVYLRDNCTASTSFHEETNQRLIDIFNDIDLEKDINGSVSVDNGDELVVKWADGHVSRFSETWLLNHAYFPKSAVSEDAVQFPPKITWNRELFYEFKKSQFHNEYSRIEETAVRKTIFNEIYQYGFTFVQNVPVSLEATKKVSELISIVRPTHYDLGIWDFTSDLSKKDTAYTSLAIDMHTDGTYWYEPPGLQLFHLLLHDGEGGETRICDVGNIVKIIQERAKNNTSWQETLKILTSEPIAFHQSGEEENVFVEDHFPILTLNAVGKLVQCRWNTSDRTSMMKHAKSPVNEIYRALARFNDLINDTSNYVRFPLSPGTILVFDNWRVLHARTAFNGKRRLCGSYLTRDDFLARFRSLSYDREKWLHQAV